MDSREQQPLFDLNEPAMEDDESDFLLCFKPKTIVLNTVDNLVTSKTTIISSSRSVNNHQFSHTSSGSAFQPFIKSKGDREKVTKLMDPSDCNVNVAMNPSRIIGFPSYRLEK
ncbi:unnamed protein product [Lactuca virosa]|uniref:Uncharacterized protein n=1 Tax=Lactuca virosa TaxID=75947 RepID=A0AAU9MP03_9ASTR|nr:unnamed protein product [Lactuca virosa]